jgi:hypothetical protein
MHTGAPMSHYIKERAIRTCPDKTIPTQVLKECPSRINWHARWRRVFMTTTQIKKSFFCLNGLWLQFFPYNFILALVNNVHDKLMTGQFLHLFVAEHWDVTGSLNSDTFETMTVLLTRMAQTVTDLLYYTYSEYYAPSEYLAVDKVTLLFKGRVIFKHYIWCFSEWKLILPWSVLAFICEFITAPFTSLLWRKPTLIRSHSSTVCQMKAVMTRMKLTMRKMAWQNNP